MVVDLAQVIREVRREVNEELPRDECRAADGLGKSLIQADRLQAVESGGDFGLGRCHHLLELGPRDVTPGKLGVAIASEIGPSDAGTHEMAQVAA
jgi:hypothetical protein